MACAAALLQQNHVQPTHTRLDRRVCEHKNQASQGRQGDGGTHDHALLYFFKTYFLFSISN